jgi:hypothetical protein
MLARVGIAAASPTRVRIAERFGRVKLIERMIGPAHSPTQALSVISPTMAPTTQPFTLAKSMLANAAFYDELGTKPEVRMALANSTTG